MFYNIYDQGFARVAACSLPVALAQPLANAERTLEAAKLAAKRSVALAVFPELGLTGYSLDDLFMQQTLLDDTRKALDWLAERTSKLNLALVVGAPLLVEGRILNCALVLHKGKILGAVPKQYLPNYREFYEHRQFASGFDVDSIGSTDKREFPVTAAQLFTCEQFTFGIEVCEDMWVPLSPGSEAALAGAEIVVNISGSPITVAKARERKLLAQSFSDRASCAYVYAAAGAGESSTDLSWDGQTFVYECGELLAESERFLGQTMTVADVDVMAIRQNRLRQGTFDDNRRARGLEYEKVDFALTVPSGDLGLERKVARFPFVPDDPERLDQDCYEAYNIQVSALMRRLASINQPKIVIGVSGGLDSSHALIVAAKALDRLGRPRTDILAYTMPGFATSSGTKNNATALAQALGVSFEVLDIKPTARRMLRELGHPAADGKPEYDVTFENVQAGLRTDYLFRLAGYKGGIVLGTGDLSETALGWCTYGVGDQMSHYNVNTGVPKTLIQYLMRWVIASGQFSAEVGATLQAILDTEISPELVPAKPGEKPQSTQDAIGPYALQDFNLFYTLRYGMPPSRIAFLAYHAWSDAAAGQWPAGVPDAERVAYTLPEIKRWLRVFLSRFFGFSQFKRSALPNGPKVVRGGSLSPRGDWRMPTDASAEIWLKELENVPE
ncbi:MAG: NAD(+) synthase [Propionibacteriaceae bacterium]|nr:NAD(+) synthase [Propionibacteriaceae bacterium]